jgi:hypothetical protein
MVRKSIPLTIREPFGRRTGPLALLRQGHRPQAGNAFLGAYKEQTIVANKRWGAQIPIRVLPLPQYPPGRRVQHLEPRRLALGVEIDDCQAPAVRREVDLTDAAKNSLQRDALFAGRRVPEFDLATILPAPRLLEVARIPLSRRR